MDHRAGYFLAFIFLLCGAARLARFNVQTNPVPKNPGPSGSQIFRRPSHSRGRGHGRRRGLRHRQRAARNGGSYSALWLGAARLAFVPDGQHLALSQLQGDQPQGPALAAHRDPVWRAHLPDLELFAARAAGARQRLRRHRHRDSRRGHHPPPLPAHHPPLQPPRSRLQPEHQPS